MNELIKELARQSGVVYDWDPGTSGPEVYFERQEDFEKFAELIVKRCIMICWAGGESDVLYEQASDTEKAFIDGQDYCVERLKEYFGIER